MPELMSAALFEKDARALVAHRRRAPFAGQWMLPIASVRDDEAAEDALRRHAREQFGIGLGEEAFVDTVYITDPDDQRQYVANIFRAAFESGPMRFNADGDYDDARWLAAAEIEQLWMPPDLRLPLIKILTEPEAPASVDWQQMGRELNAQAAPLAERDASASPPPREEPPPDNRQGWDAIAEAYQQERYGDRDAGRLKWSRGVHEDELRLFDDVHGKRALVLGCGGGQDCVALERMGAVAVGIDQSTAQIAYARKYAQRHGAKNVSFVEGTVEDLSRFDDASFDLAISIHVLGYVERGDRAIAEAARVLKPGGVLAISVPHPWDQIFDEAPYTVVRSYWSDRIDWTWKLEDGTAAGFREYRRTVQQWFAMLVDAGFTVERLIEPYQGDISGDDAKGFDLQRARLMAYVLIFKARKR